MTPGDPDSDFDYDPDATIKAVLGQTRTRLEALDAERRAIAVAQRRWQDRPPNSAP